MACNLLQSDRRRDDPRQLTYAEFPLTGMSLLLFSVPLGFVATGMFSVVGSILTELFPTELRGSLPRIPL